MDYFGFWTREIVGYTWVIMIAIGLSGCQDNSVTVRCRPYHQWRQAYYISNEDVQVVVVPAVGRIVSYRLMGHHNVLWANPKVFQDAAARSTSKSLKTTPIWRNYGGQKIWAWPQLRWLKWFGQTWPPPPQFGQQRQRAQIVGEGTVRLISPCIGNQDWRISQTISLAAHGTQLTISAHFISCNDPPSRPSKDGPAVWSIVQLPIPLTLKACLTGKKKIRRIQFPSNLRIIGRSHNWVYIDPTPRKQAKIGLDADKLQWFNGRQRFTVRLADSSPGTRKSAEQAQIYINPISQYVELEFTSARPHDRWASLTVVWTLTKLTHQIIRK